MDWRAVAWALAEQGPPMIVFDHRHRILLVSSQMERLLGWDLRPPDDECARDVRGFAAAQTGRVSIVTPDGREVSLFVETSTATHAGLHATVVVARSAFEVRARRSTEDRVTYEVRTRMTRFGALARIETAGGAWHYWGDDAPFCYSVLHGRDLPCTDCPLFRPESKPCHPIAVGRHRTGDTSYDVLAVDASAEPARCALQTVSREQLRGVRELQIDELAQCARLTRPERQLLVFASGGASTREIADHLGISVRAARTREARLMRKLRLHSRSALASLLL